jgi:hypothetical protein
MQGASLLVKFDSSEGFGTCSEPLPDRGKLWLKLDMKREMKLATIAILYMTEPRLVKLLMCQQW